MRRLGLIGGMSWESTLLYYRSINQLVAARLGGLHSAELVLHSVDFAAIAALQAASDWDTAAASLATAARGLRAAGAAAVVLATNTMHKVADTIEREGGLPLLHIADATGAAVRAAGIGVVGLLGTRFTMQDPTIVIDRLQRSHGLRVIVPDAPRQDAVHRVIYDELCRGVVRAASRDAFVQTIVALAAAGAEGVILGCTEITLLIDAASSPLPVFDSTALHAQHAADWMLGDEPRGDLR